MNYLTLWLASEQNPQLVRTEFRSSAHNLPRIAVRGKTSGAHLGAGTFQWTSAVCAMTVLLLRGAAFERTPNPPGGLSIFLSGTRPSLASSLDDALYKAPAWLDDVFGSDVRGGLLARRLVITTNRALHRPGPVEHTLNPRFLKGMDITTHLGEGVIASADRLWELSDLIERQWTGEQLPAPHPRQIHDNQTSPHRSCVPPFAIPSAV